MKRFLHKLVGLRRGQTTAEYAIIVALIAISSIAVILIFGDQIRSLFAAEAHQLSGDSSATAQDRATGADAQIPGSLDKF